MNRQGLTLIELVTVIGLLGILAMIAIPRFASVREEALISTLKADLHTLRYAQEVYNVEPDGEYASTVQELGDTFVPSSGVSVTLTGGGEHYEAEASHPGTSVVCSFSTETNLLVCEEEVEEDPKK